MLACIQVPRCPRDYRVWLETMYSNFGQKWAKLHHGPLWSAASSMQAGDLPAGDAESNKRQPLSEV